MADQDSTVSLEYSQCPWGDLIYGTKEQLQGLGLGVDIPFPGEPGGPHRLLKAPDPRGFTAKITTWYDGRFCASIRFPGRAFQESGPQPFAPGVTKQACGYRDEYVGTAEALSSAGLASIDHFPGRPGMRKVRVTIYPDGTVANGPPTANDERAHLPGAKRIERNSKSTFRVLINIPKDEGERRQLEEKTARDAWEQKIAALPRPDPLRVRHRCAAPSNSATRWRLLRYLPVLTVSDFDDAQAHKAINVDVDINTELQRQLEERSPARLPVGELYAMPLNGSECCKNLLVKVISPFGMYAVIDNGRTTYRPGYLVADGGGGVYFAAPYQIRALK